MGKLIILLLKFKVSLEVGLETFKHEEAVTGCRRSVAHVNVFIH